MNRRQFLKKIGTVWLGTATFGFLPSFYQSSQLPIVQDSSPHSNTQAKTKRILPNQLTGLTQEEIDFLAAHELIRGDSSRKVAMLTYDDASSVNGIQHLMDVYRENGAKMAVFVIGNNLDSCKAILPQLIAEGHELGCHGWTHNILTPMSDDGIRNEFDLFLQKTAEILPDYRVKYFRAPYGERNQRVRDIAAQFGLQHVLWSLESGGQDTTTYHNVVDRLQPGEIILSHESRFFDVNDADVILRELIRKGYNLENITTGMDPSDRWIDASPTPTQEGLQ